MYKTMIAYYTEAPKNRENLRKKVRNLKLRLSIDLHKSKIDSNRRFPPSPRKLHITDFALKGLTRRPGNGNEINRVRLHFVAGTKEQATISPASN